MTKVVVWIAECTWHACVDAARLIADAEVTLVHVVDAEVAEAMQGAYGGLLSRHGHAPDVSALVGPAEQALVEDAAARLGTPCATDVRQGRIEHEVVAACADADVLICARDGRRDHAGPKSLGHHTRFVVDHAPCGVLLVWP
ncbi:MAG: UspA protein [Amycolatopsis sp.]|jgi:nucleotide-binding universal stress UspA family protein|uniref:universal stress protein n=1 Tax=Amycolatopsis sp. TaxID=37632 RepID=UPI00263317F7|nr:universal stress protein [Amycolatopsis sp.]MCU1686132.1 UspA protein [Amycolatopsis sp.]